MRRDARDVAVPKGLGAGGVAQAGMGDKGVEREHLLCKGGGDAQAPWSRVSS